MSIGEKVFSSAFLLLIRKIWSNVINLGVMAFLARILSKEDFGILAISSVFLGLINTAATSGISEYVVYYRGNDKNEKVNAAFWLNLFLTLAIIFIAIATGPWWASFYQNDRIYTLLLLLLVSFFFEMSSTIPRALLRIDLDYKTLVYYSSISMTLISIGKLIAAFTGLGVYSLALPQALVSPFLMLVLFAKKKWKPDFSFGLIHFRDIYNYCKHIIGGRVLTKFVNEGDNLIVGKFIGLEGLGVYTLAFQLANLVTTNVVFIANDLFLPLFSKVKDDMSELKGIFLRMIGFLSFISFPIITVVFLCAKGIVGLIYGSAWLDAIIPLQILCLFTLGRSISSPSSSLYNAIGRPDIGFKIASYFTPLFLISVFVGSYFGVIGVAISTSIVRLTGSIISIGICLKLIHVSNSDFFKIIKSNFWITIIFAALFSILFNFIEMDLIFISVIAPVIFYLHLLAQRLLFYDVFRLFQKEIKKYVKFNSVNSLFNKVFFIP